jgi:Tfp pilus assembly protein PilF
MMSDIFDVQDEITLAVVDALKLKLLGSTKSSVLKRETENTEAYKAYLRGRYLRYAKNDHAAAAIEFQEAVKLDPLHAPSWVALAESYVLRAHYALIHPLEACSKSNEALEKAHSIQGESAESLYIRGFTAIVERDWNTMFASYRRSIELDPNDPRTLSTFGVINCVMGRVDDGLAIFERARTADPLAPYPYAMTACGLLCARRLKDSMQFLHQALAFVPDHPLALWILSVAEVALGNFDEGIRAAEKTVALSNRAAFFVALHGWALGSAGRKEEATLLLNELRDRPKGSPIAPAEAGLLATLGEIDAAFEVYSKAVDEHEPVANYAGLPCFDDLRADPRFDEIVSRMKFPR